MFRLLQVITLSVLVQAAAPLHALPASSANQLVDDRAPQKTLPAPDTTEAVALKQKIELLEAQLQITREYQGSLLDTVYWSLGSVFLLVGLLLGFGWFINLKVYERDKDILKAELETTMRVKAAELDGSIAKQVTTVTETLSKQLKESITESLKPHATSVATAERRIFKLEFLRLKENMDSNASNSMALTDGLNLLELCYKKAQNEVPDIIHSMLKRLDEGGKLTADEITRVNSVIDALPTHYKALTDKLRAKLVASDIF